MQSEKVFFGRRKVIINEIVRRAASGARPEAAAEELELVRRNLGVSLHGLWKWLNDRKVKGLI